MKHRYEDPTGGGDDAILDLPDLWTPPPAIRVEDQSGEWYSLNYVGEEDE